MKYALIYYFILLLLGYGFYQLYRLIVEVQRKKIRKYSRKRNRYLSLLILLLPFSMVAQADSGLKGIDCLSATLTPPDPLPEHFEFISPIYIETSDNDTIFRDTAKVFVNEKEFYLIRGNDTLSRRICHFQYNFMELHLSCGDWIRPRRDYNGNVYALRYKEGDKSYYFSTKWMQRNLND